LAMSIWQWMSMAVWLTLPARAAASMTEWKIRACSSPTTSRVKHPTTPSVQVFPYKISLEQPFVRACSRRGPSCGHKVCCWASGRCVRPTVVRVRFESCHHFIHRRGALDKGL
jgi:hypothetical protein